MPTTKALIALSDVMAYLPVRSGNDAFDARLTQLIKVATAQIESATGRYFTQQAHIQLFSTPRTAQLRYDLYGAGNEDGVITDARRLRLVLKGIPISAGDPFVVSYDPRRLYGTDTVLDPAGYSLRRDTGVLVVTAPFSEGVDYLQVAYTAGYAAHQTETERLDGVPEDLKLACVAQVVHLFNRITADNIGVDGDRGAGRVPAAKFTRYGGLTPEAASMVAHYRQPLVGRR